MPFVLFRFLSKLKLILRKVILFGNLTEPI